MYERSLVRLKYHARANLWYNNTEHACSERKATNVQCEQFLEATKNCRSVQESPSVVSFYSGAELVGQAIWQHDADSDSTLQFRLLLA
ncbi:hypothetical protein pEaSNUABM14_00250 [Erwinia phage pEa_SNUABM_14]|uniref:Uncharacterized protein n=1 Tax=Erwinia phage pEa_SNUABM_7 TaxID=2866695 RepID=A0AAE7WT63_9CAUD|nr:hypothetical protein MPK74_gp251 [Erwinia phage pEa_SNUABM_7]QYW04575.1 hypothetical protein pEaSNUABM14_00250 [Erwinia phage pEa_SNUABM_14]QYW04919.1 hypothetical protein pEaSNUABM7_00251 [Erwinia phage pEa_SNUABM_7]